MGRSKIFIGFALAGALGIWLLYGLFRPTSITREASSLLSAALEGNGDTLYKFSFEKERKYLKLTPAKLDALWRRLVIPRFNRLAKRGPVSAMALNDPPSQGVAYVDLSDGVGRRYQLSTAVWATDEGPRYTVLNYLLAAWNIEYLVARDRPITRETIRLARAEGLRRDLPALREIGIAGYVPMEPDSSPIPWEEYQQRLVRATGSQG